MLLKYSSEWDDIQSVVENLANNILVALSHIFNQSLNIGIFIILSKRAKIILIPKVRNPNTCQSVPTNKFVTNFFLILEKIVHKRFYPFLTSNNLLSPTQFGFRNLSFTSHAATYLASIITSS